MKLTIILTAGNFTCTARAMTCSADRVGLVTAFPVQLRPSLIDLPMAALEDPSLTIDSPRSARDNDARMEVFQSIIVNGFLESGRNKKLRLMVIGEAGGGKSTLISALVGKEIDKADGVDLQAGTSEIKHYEFDQNGVNIEIWDTPGFGMGTREEDDKMVESLMASVGLDVDLALFCVRLDATRFPTRVHQDTIRKLTQILGPEFWKYCLFVLTFANNVEQLHLDPDKTIKQFFSDRCSMFEKHIKKTLYNYADLSEENCETVCTIPVGSSIKGLYPGNPWLLPGIDDWFIQFWIECTKHIKGSSLSVLLCANSHRLEEMGSESSDIVLPPEAHNRPGATHAAHMREIPLYEILRIQLFDKDSTLWKYITEFAKAGAKTGDGPVIGHLVGARDG